ncbi:hypothetical protein FD724_07390 [Nostoc sp. C057]|uniref:hypothetical protein n=1 Tax=Nostoc sp. C057 TaxID=2576903 RepID=UPI0015C2C4EF|nr:hypothetical protein [Nostoc sp. C057]QLE47958.1 hypothetical protein FD724_07390 [Nostoc sp. C057]
MNPIGFKVECESIEEYCDRHNYRDPFLVDGNWWAFPPHAVMAVPVITTCKKVWVWDGSYPASTPFEVEHISLCDRHPIPWKYKVVYSSKARFTVTCVRTDVYPLSWVYWWVYFRLKESLRLCEAFLVFLLEIWGLAETKDCMRASWRDIKIFRHF